MPDSPTTTQPPLTPRTPAPPPHCRDRRTRGSCAAFKLGFPIFLGYMPVGVAFGILARTLGFSVLAATVCSATALAGAGQFIALAVLASGATVFEVLAATTVVNLRYVLFGSTLSPYLHGVPLHTQAGLAFSLTDETFAVNIADHRAGLSTPASMLGVGAVAWTGWVLGTLHRRGGRRAGSATRALRRRLRDARDVHGAVHRACREPAPRRDRRARRRHRACCCRCCPALGFVLVLELVHRHRVDDRGDGRGGDLA